MIELMRTNDLVLISRVEAILDEAGLDFFIADQHMSAMEGSLGFLPRRVLVADEDAPRRARLCERRALPRNCEMAEPAEAGEDVAATDAFFGGRLRLRQPARGHRAGTDALLLAAAAPLEFEDLALDVGAGVGAAGLAFAALRPKARIGLIEIDPATAALARENLALNGMAERGEVFEADALVPMRRRAVGLVDARAGLVISNPPFLDPRRTRASPDPDRRRAHVAPADAAEDGASQAPYEAWLAAWIAACLALARPGGTLILIHRPEALGAMLAALEGRAGAATVLPVYARAEAPATRILLRAKKGSRAPLSIAPGLILHENARFTASRRGDPSRRGGHRLVGRMRCDEPVWSIFFTRTGIRFARKALVIERMPIAPVIIVGVIIGMVITAIIVMAIWMIIMMVIGTIIATDDSNNRLFRRRARRRARPATARSARPAKRLKPGVACAAEPMRGEWRAKPAKRTEENRR